MRKIVSIVCSSAAKCIDSFPRPLLLRMPLDNGVVARKVGCPLSANSNNISSAILSQAPCGLFSKEYHPLLFRTWTNKWPLSDTKFSCKYFHDSGICQAFIFVAFSVTRDVIEHWHKQKASLWKFLVFVPSRSIDHWFYHRAATLWILGRCSTRIQSTLHW